MQLSVLLLTLAAGPDVTVSSKVQLYADTDRTVVVSPHVTGTVTIPTTKTSLNATYTEDIVSSASVDVRTTASPRIYDRRQEVDFGAGQEVAGFQIGGSYMHARERDYLSNGGSLTISRELFQKNTTISLRGGFMSNVVGRADDPLYQAPMTDWSGDLALTQIFTPTTIAQLNVTVARTNGMIASPYRKVRVNMGTTDAPLVVLMPENEPGDRFRFAAALGVKQYLGSFLVLHGEYRLYRDSWSVLSHTVDARVILDLSPITLRFRYRFYTQSRASFYEPFYDSLKLYLSSDRELSAFTSHLFGIKADWQPLRTEKTGAAFRFDVKVEGMYFNYPEFIRLHERWALIAQVGAGVDF